MPAVAGTSAATENIEDDDFIFLDGTMGPLEIISMDPC
ncbi:MAG: hypothetical protein JSW56_19635 [Deltaproteobacteria bacterium]|nr:MAG: hypothetical protein JSW56_19635 [Deltaproteobacteria bacterium]